MIPFSQLFSPSPSPSPYGSNIQKLTVQLFPKTEGLYKAIEFMGFNPYLQVRVKNTKTISYVVKHLEQKWRVVVEKINERRPPSQRYQFRIYPRQWLYSHPGWGRDDETTLLKIHQEYMSPNVLQLDYDVKEMDVSDIFNLSQQQPHIVNMSQQHQQQQPQQFVSTQQLQQLHQLQQQQLQQQIQQQLQQQLLQQQQQQQFMIQQQQFQQQLQQQLQQPLQALNRGLIPQLSAEESVMLQQLQQIQQQQQQRQIEQQLREQLIQQEQARLLQLQQLVKSGSNRNSTEESSLLNSISQQATAPSPSFPGLGMDSSLLMGGQQQQQQQDMNQMLQQQLNIQIQQQQVQPNVFTGLQRRTSTSGNNSNKTPTRTYTFHSQNDFTQKLDKKRKEEENMAMAAFDGLTGPGPNNIPNRR